MQMVSASKMRKAQNATLASRTYSQLSWDLIRSLADKAPLEHPLLAAHDDAKKIGIVLVTTNRGLVGSFNANLLSMLRKTEREQAEVITEIISIGRKGRDAAGRLHKPVIAAFDKSDAGQLIDDIYPVAKLITDQYKSGAYKAVYILFNDFVSTLLQKPTLKQLLPFSDVIPAEAGIQNNGSVLDSGSRPYRDLSGMTSIDYQFEPDPKDVIEALIPRIVESQLYQALLESDASEHSARMIMMKNATDAAGDLIDDLTLTFNQIRQNKITTELSEITAGKSALEK